MGRFSIRVSGEGARRGGVRGLVWSFLRRHGLVEDETAGVARWMWFALALLVPVGGLLMVWGYHISSPYLMLAGLVTVALGEVICLVLTVVVVWRIARIIIGDYRAGRLQWLTGDKSRTR